MRTHARHGIPATLVAISTATLTLFGTTPAQAALPTPVSAATAHSYLASLTVSAEHSRTGYSRDLFPHWITISGTCNTRETVLKRDAPASSPTPPAPPPAAAGTPPTTAPPGTPPPTWTSTTSSPSPKHGTPAPTTGPHPSGRPSPTTSPAPNSSPSPTTSTSPKATRPPATWWPSRTTYARAWVQVKYYYGLSVDPAEKSALSSVLNGC